MTLEEKINDILEEARNDDYERTKYPWKIEYGEKSVSQVILEAVKESMPKCKPVHTYASENADEYRAYDNGFKDCLADILKILEQ